MTRRYRKYRALVRCEARINGKYYPISGKFKFNKQILGEQDLTLVQQKIVDMSKEITTLNIKASDIIITSISSLKIK
ncbi:hypothetical protein DUK53_08635 [Listeria sp. SHR_NRA_18]|uniref:hypothetical protein n=1 Tax=Listeria TaxID=1637 RepID=UPI00051E0A09|nr:MULTISPECIES: hypothetical protein [Listeria]KGL46032.1 hypothetical protein EP56_02855 [Listeriaceae bacterium FSL A5-0209]RQW66694.1 hypothetical protein DUK53_08635 [Listeria sp. SHR_NRA_18]